jgi:hypothetical protein
MADAADDIEGKCSVCEKDGYVLSEADHVGDVVRVESFEIDPDTLTLRTCKKKLVLVCLKCHKELDCFKECTAPPKSEGLRYGLKNQ